MRLCWGFPGDLFFLNLMLLPRYWKDSKAVKEERDRERENVTGIDMKPGA